MDVDKYKEELNQRLMIPESGLLSTADISALLKKRGHSVARRFSIFFRIEILICLSEIVQELFAIASAHDWLAIAYAALNIIISAVFIFIFIRLIRRVNNPVVVSLPLKEHIGNLLATTENFYRNYMRFILYDVIIDFCYDVIRVFTVGMDESYPPKLVKWVNSLPDSFTKAVFLVGYQLAFAIVLYFLSRLVIRLFYRKSLKKLRQIYSDIQGPQTESFLQN